MSQFRQQGFDISTMATAYSISSQLCLIKNPVKQLKIQAKIFNLIAAVLEEDEDEDEVEKTMY